MFWGNKDLDEIRRNHELSHFDAMTPARFSRPHLPRHSVQGNLYRSSGFSLDDDDNQWISLNANGWKLLLHRKILTLVQITISRDAKNKRKIKEESVEVQPSLPQNEWLSQTSENDQLSGMAWPLRRTKYYAQRWVFALQL